MISTTGLILIGVGIYIVVLIFGLSPFILSSKISREEEKRKGETYE